MRNGGVSRIEPAGFAAFVSAGGRQSASQAENVGSAESLNPKFGLPGGSADSAALTGVQEPEGVHGLSPAPSFDRQEPSDIVVDVELIDRLGHQLAGE